MDYNYFHAPFGSNKSNTAFSQIKPLGKTSSSSKINNAPLPKVLSSLKNQPAYSLISNAPLTRQRSGANDPLIKVDSSKAAPYNISHLNFVNQATSLNAPFGKSGDSLFGFHNFNNNVFGGSIKKNDVSF